MAQTTPLLTADKPLQIFKPGRHTAMSGQTLRFTEADLAATCAAYDPAKHEAPLVVGHPAHDLPAYGWVQSLAFADGGIDAIATQVNADFAEMVNAGAFKKISASFYAKDSPNNPVPGVHYLRHVGLLGAQAPAVKGMRCPSFADTEEGVLTFSEWDDVQSAGFFRNIKNFILRKYGGDEAEATLPESTLVSLEQSAQDEVMEAAAEDAASGQTDATATPQTQFAEPQTPKKESTVSPEEKAALEAENKRLNAELSAFKATQVNAANVAFCENLKGLPPAARSVMVATLNHFATQGDAIQFGEGDAKAPLLDQLKEALTALPPLVQFGEHATHERAGSAVDTTNAEAIAAQATAIQASAEAAGTPIAYAHAVSQVMRGN
jgi:hypothetical protein